MDSLSTFLEMGGYGSFVWPAFAVTAALLLALLGDSLRRLRAAQKALARLEAEIPGRRRRKSDGQSGLGG